MKLLLKQLKELMMNKYIIKLFNYLIIILSDINICYLLWVN
jgi:hypothetical protein